MTATANEFAGIYRGKKQHEPDFEAVLDRAAAAGVKKVMLTGMSLHDVDLNLEIVRSRPELCSLTVGVHPYHAAEPENEGSLYFQTVRGRVCELVKSKPPAISAFGELGLDYDRLEKASKDVQTRTFKAQLDMAIAERFDLPLFLHCREAFDDFVTIIKPYLSSLPRKGLVHSFVGSKSQMEELVEMGLHIGVSGFSFRDETTCDMVKHVPLGYLQIETDAPWGEISPNSELAKRYIDDRFALPTRKKKDKFEMGMMVKDRNESCTIGRVAAVVAGLKGMSVKEAAEAAWSNSTEMFSLHERC